MTCINKDIAHWTIYDARNKQFTYLTNKEFKNFLLSKPVKLMGSFIKVNSMEKVWIDAMINTEWWV